MSLVPVSKRTGKKRTVSESERRRVKDQKAKADYHNRNGGRWKK